MENGRRAISVFGWVGLVVCMAILVGPGCAGPSRQTGSVTHGKEPCGGTVTDAVSAQPVAGAQVVVFLDTLTEFGSPRHIIGSTMTDHRGRFVLPSNPVTIQYGASILWVAPCPKLRATAPGYEDLIIDIKRPRPDMEIVLQRAKRR